jgi:peptide subunit release factor 1 (eRF1)
MFTQEQQQTIEKLKIKRILDFIDSAEGKGTSMVSLYIPSGAQVSRYTKKVNEEYHTATSIKSRV